MAFAGVAELVDAPDLGSGAAKRESSSLSIRTNFKGLVYGVAETPCKRLVRGFDSLQVHHKE